MVEKMESQDSNKLNSLAECKGLTSVCSWRKSVIDLTMSHNLLRRTKFFKSVYL